MLQFGILLYFCVSSGFLVIALHIAKRLDRKVSWIEMAIFLLFGPVYILVKSLLDVLYPPSKDPFDLVYTRLSYYEGKSSEQILREINEADETIGWGAKYKIESLLEVMVAQQHARRKRVSQRKQILDGLRSDQLTACEGEVESEAVSVVDLSPEQIEQLKQRSKQLIGNLEKAEEKRLEDGLGECILYYRGVPLGKRGKKISFPFPVFRPSRA